MNKNKNFILEAYPIIASEIKKKFRKITKLMNLNKKIVETAEFIIIKYVRLGKNSVKKEDYDSFLASCLLFVLKIQKNNDYDNLKEKIYKKFKPNEEKLKIFMKKIKKV